MNGNALPVHFYGADGYGSYYGYGCMTFKQFEYVRLVVRGQKWGLR